MLEKINSDKKIKNKLCAVCKVLKAKEEWQRFLYRLSVCVCRMEGVLRVKWIQLFLRG